MRLHQFPLRHLPDCDCNSWNDVPLVPDIGILASKDPVALDQASVILSTVAGKDLLAATRTIGVPADDASHGAAAAPIG